MRVCADAIFGRYCWLAQNASRTDGAIAGHPDVPPPGRRRGLGVVTNAILHIEGISSNTSHPHLRAEVVHSVLSTQFLKRCIAGKHRRQLSSSCIVFYAQTRESDCRKASSCGPQHAVVFLFLWFFCSFSCLIHSAKRSGTKKIR